MKHIRRKITLSVLGTMLFVFAVLLATVNIFIPEYLTAEAQKAILLEDERNYAVLLLIEKYILRPKARFAVPMHIYTLLFVMLGFVLFDSSGVADAFMSFKSMFGFAGIPAVNAASLYYLKSNLVLLIVAAVGATPLPKRIYEKIGGTAGGSRVLAVLTPTAAAAAVAVCTAYLIDGSFNPFVYFRF